MTARARGRLFWALAGLGLALGDALVLWHHVAGAPHGYQYWLETTLSGTTSAALAGLLLSRRPGHPFGRLAAVMAGACVVQLLGGATASLATLRHVPRTLAVLSAYASVTAQSGLVAGLLLVLLVAPTGRPASRFGRVACWSTPVVFGALLGAALLSPNLNQGAYLDGNPLATGSTTSAQSFLQALGGLAALVLAGCGIATLRARFRASTGEQHAQVKVVVFGGVVGVALVLTDAALPVATPGDQLIGSVAWALAGASVPIATTFAVLRHGLYDIDRVVSRTLSYAVVTGLIVGVYVGIIATADAIVGSSSSLAVAASTLVAAAAFQPVRKRVQRAVDRRFDRAAYDARRTVDVFSARLRDEVDVDAVRAELLATVATAVAPRDASLWVAS